MFLFYITWQQGFHREKSVLVQSFSGRYFPTFEPNTKISEVRSCFWSDHFLFFFNCNHYFLNWNTDWLSGRKNQMWILLMIQKQTFETVLKNSSFEKSQENMHDTVYSLCIEIDVILCFKIKQCFQDEFGQIISFSGK